MRVLRDVMRDLDEDLNQHNDKNINSGSDGRYIFLVFSLTLTLVAIYLSNKCNKGFSFSGFLMAIFFPYFYIAYTFATKGMC